jgi:hypothetical protein
MGRNLHLPRQDSGATARALQEIPVGSFPTAGTLDGSPVDHLPSRYALLSHSSAPSSAIRRVLLQTARQSHEKSSLTSSKRRVALDYGRKRTEDVGMVLDPLAQRCARLLWEGYKAANWRDIVMLDGAVAEAAGMPYGTREYNAVMYQLESVRGAVEEAPHRAGTVGYMPYRITGRGFALMREAGYLP